MTEKLVKITEAVSIHLPADVSPTAQAEIVALLRKELAEPERIEADLKELLHHEAEGKLLVLEDVLADLGLTRSGDGEAVP